MVVEMTFHDCCRRVLASAKDANARAYAAGGLYCMTTEEVRCQALYLRSNLSTWRADDARTVRAHLDHYSRA